MFEMQYGQQLASSRCYRVVFLLEKLQKVIDCTAFLHLLHCLLSGVEYFACLHKGMQAALCSGGSAAGLTDFALIWFCVHVQAAPVQSTSHAEPAVQQQRVLPIGEAGELPPRHVGSSHADITGQEQAHSTSSTTGVALISLC